MKRFFVIIGKYNFTLLYGLLFLVVIILYTYSHIDFKALIAAFGAIATLYYGKLKLQIEDDKIFKELFNTFNERYDRRFNNLISELKANESKVLALEEKQLIIDYFNLCAEEFLWRKKKRIPNDVWKAWRSGIIENLKIKQVKELYVQETYSNYGKDSYYGLYDELTT